MYIIFFIKVKDSNELSIAAHFFHCHLTGFLKDTSLHLCRCVSSIAAHFFHCHLTCFLKDTSLHLCWCVSSFLIPLICSLHFRRNCTSSVFFFKVRKSSSVALESTSINFTFFRAYYLFNQFIKNRQENFCNRKCNIPTAKNDNSNYER